MSIPATVYSPGLHVLDHPQVVFVSLDPSLELVEQVAELHADHQTRHAQEDVAPQLATQTHHMTIT